MNNRRQQDPHLAEIINTLNKHSESIEQNKQGIQRVVENTDRLREALSTHVHEEAKYWKIVERLEGSLDGLMSLMNDLAGLGRLGSRVGRVGKWFAGIGGFAAMFYFVWDWLVDHIGKN